MGPWTTPHTRVIVLSVEAVTVRSMGTSRPVGRLKRKECTAKKNTVNLVAGLSFFPIVCFFQTFSTLPLWSIFFFFIQSSYLLPIYLRRAACFLLLFFFIQWKIHGNHDAFSQYKSSSQQSGGKKSFSLMVMEAEFCKVQRTLQYYNNSKWRQDVLRVQPNGED